MKKKIIFVLAMAVCCSLTSCKVNLTIGGKSSSSQISASISSEESRDSISSNVSISSNDSIINKYSSTSTTSITSKTSSVSTSPATSESTSQVFDTYTLNINYSDIQCGTYTNNYSYGNENITHINGFGFNIYRAQNTVGGILIKNDNTYYSNTSYHGEEGAFYNTTPIKGIKSISIEYSYTGGTSTNLPHIRFGITNELTGTDRTFPSTNNKFSISFSSDMNEYFKIYSGDYNLKISNIEIVYLKETISNPTYLAKSGEGGYRCDPIKYTGTLTPGVSKVIVPIESTYNSSTNKMNVTKTKELTYYTTSYVNSNRSVMSQAAITDPIEVCAYYTAFGTWPANYALKGDTSSVSFFGNDARQVSQYTRTDGYAKSVPYNNYGSTGKPLYYELDVALTSSYSLSNRDVGRIVVWEAGFTGTNYDDSPVCTYTDDHYATWLEYYNNGTFSKRFNGDGYYSAYSYSSPMRVSFGTGI